MIEPRRVWKETIMKESLIQKLQEISAEEHAYLDGQANVKKEIYTKQNMFEIDKQLFLKKERLITVRPHSRFVNFPEHSHNYIEIMYVCEGSIIHYIEGKEIVMQKGDMLLLNQHVKHSVKKAGFDDVGINFIALPEFFDIPLKMLRENNVLADFLVKTLRQNYKKSGYLLFKLEGDSAVENLMENMITSMINEEEEDDNLNQYSMGLVFLYLMKHVENLTTNTSQNYLDVILQTTLDYIDTSYKTANLTKLAEDFHQSLSVLSKLIKQSTGFTFQELLQKKRFQKAVELLMKTDLAVDEISFEVGYENKSYFYRQFKERYGMTPRQYRIQNANGK